MSCNLSKADNPSWSLYSIVHCIRHGQDARIVTFSYSASLRFLTCFIFR